MKRRKSHSPSFPSLHLGHRSFSNTSVALSTSHLILQSFRCFTYVPVHSPTLLSLLLSHKLFPYVTWRAAHKFSLQESSFSELSVASPTSQLILQPFRRFIYVTDHSPNVPLLHVRHSSFSNPSFASPKSQALHVFYLASRPQV